MQSANRYDGVDPRAVQFIRYHARQLARLCAVPGMEVSDYEQELAAHLLDRSDRFDPSRSSYPTFADRLIRNRAASLAEFGSRRIRTSQHANNSHGTEDRAIETDGLWPASLLPTHERASLRLDLQRFIEQLPMRLRRCCEWLIAQDRRTAASMLGLHHSSLYEAAAELRHHARQAGLHRYL